MHETHDLAPLTLGGPDIPGPEDAATAILVEEHSTLRIVLRILQRVVHESVRFGVEADFGILCSIVYYIDEFPERVHHPKEELHLFPMLRRRTSRFDALLERLRADHEHSARMLGRIQRDLVHYQAGAPDGAARFSSSIARYAGLLESHMQTEERLLADARNDLARDDWLVLQHEFAAATDPLASEARVEFRRLRARILAVLPSKMRLDRDSAAAMRRVDRV